MWNGDIYASTKTSFIRPVTPPTVGPVDDLRVFVGLNLDWVPYVLGALKQLYPPSVWDTTSSGTLSQLECWWNTLAYTFMEAPSSIEFPIQLQILPDGTLQYSLDDGFSWADTGFRFGRPPANFPFPIPNNVVQMGTGVPFVYNPGGSDLLRFP